MSTVTSQGKTRGQIERETRLREARVLELRGKGMDYAEIAEEVGYRNPESARQALQRALSRHEDPHVERLRAVEDHKLYKLERVLWDIIDTRHIAYSFGKTMKDADGNLVEDQAPRIQAANALVRVSERRSRLHGMDAPMKKIVEVVSADVMEQEIARINAMADALMDAPVNTEAVNADA